MFASRFNEGSRMERSPSTASVGSRQHSRSSTRLSLHGGSRQQSAPRVRKYKEEVVNEIVKGAPTHPYRPNTSGLGDDFDGWSVSCGRVGTPDAQICPCHPRLTRRRVPLLFPEPFFHKC